MSTTTPIEPDLVTRSVATNWNYARWSQLPDDGNRYEVIDGVLYVTASPAFFHQWIIRQIVRVLFDQIDDRGIGITTWAPIAVLMPGCDPVQPDILAVRQEDLGIIHDRRIRGVPALIVEVLSPSNPAQDLVVKRGAYARAGLPEYWIVRPVERDVIVLSAPDPAAGDYHQESRVAPDGELISPTLPFRATIAAFFAGAPDETP